MKSSCKSNYEKAIWPKNKPFFDDEDLESICKIINVAIAAKAEAVNFGFGLIALKYPKKKKSFGK